jgi:hypothetical protein
LTPGDDIVSPNSASVIAAIMRAGDAQLCGSVLPSGIAFRMRHSANYVAGRIAVPEAIDRQRRLVAGPPYRELQPWSPH